ncbi:MAG: hypothetical protein PWP23_2420 [Candidatus Sumerlaeota bacterium]|nr:hypothetical protein [Candidatus Sumerlaeota bacterium]
MRKALCTLGAALLCSAVSAQTIVYLNFDDAADATGIAEGTAYTLGASEVDQGSLFGLSLSYTMRNHNGDGPSIGAPAGVSGTSQGGKALLVDSGAGQDEGLTITSDNGILQDVTIEVVWYTNDASGGSNTAGIQTPIGNEWPAGEAAQLFIRTVGADRMDFWTDRGDSNSENVQILGTGVVAANTWYHDVLVLDYNDASPANSQIIAYRNGAQVGTSTYDASSASATLFPTGYNSLRRIGVGIHNSLEANTTDHRGLSGGVDAIALSAGVLTPSNFVLPTGAVVSSVNEWQMFE